MKILISVLLSLSFSSVCHTSTKKPRLVFIGDFLISPDQKDLKNPVGGLSSLFFDQKTQSFYAISDNRGQYGPIRAYQIFMDFSKISKKKIPQIKKIKEIFLKEKDGTAITPLTFDGEGLVLHPEGHLFISSEGDRKPLNIPPSISAFTTSGKKIYDLPLPKVYWDTKDSSRGVKDNSAFESLALTPSGGQLYTATEEPLKQDKETGFLRIQEFDLKTKKPSGQFAYQIEEGENNGLTELIALERKKFLSLERRFIKKTKKQVIRTFIIDCRNATDLSHQKSLKKKDVKKKAFKACQKTLLADLKQFEDKLSPQHPRLDNLEGMSFGPDLPGGGKWLFLVSDDNFNDSQKTQILVFHWFDK